MGGVMSEQQTKSSVYSTPFSTFEDAIQLSLEGKGFKQKEIIDAIGETFSRLKKMFNKEAFGFSDDHEEFDLSDIRNFEYSYLKVLENNFNFQKNEDEEFSKHSALTYFHDSFIDIILSDKPMKYGKMRDLIIIDYEKLDIDVFDLFLLFLKINGRNSRFVERASIAESIYLPEDNPKYKVKEKILFAIAKEIIAVIDEGRFSRKQYGEETYNVMKSLKEELSSNLESNKLETKARLVLTASNFIKGNGFIVEKNNQKFSLNQIMLNFYIDLLGREKVVKVMKDVCQESNICYENVFESEFIKKIHLENEKNEQEQENSQDEELSQ